MRNCQRIVWGIGFICFLCLMVGCQNNRCIPCKLREQRIQQSKAQPGTPESQAIEQKRLTELKSQLKLTPFIEKWHHHLPKNSIRRLYIVDNLLLVETKNKQLFAFARKTGIPQWVYTVGNQIDFALGKDADKIYLLSMAKLHILDKKNGRLLVKKELDFVPSSAPCVNDKYIYIGGWDSFLYALDKKTLLADWRYRIDGHIKGMPTVLDGVLYCAATDQNLYAINSETGKSMGEWAKNGVFQTRAANVVKILVQKNPPTLYAASRDYNVYSLNRITGGVKWKYESGGEINQHPYLIGNSLYLVSSSNLNGNNTLYVLDTELGELKWKIKGGTSLFFLGKYHDWVIKTGKKIVAIHNETGKVRNSFDLNKFQLLVTNIIDNTGYLATEDGYIFCVEE